MQKMIKTLKIYSLKYKISNKYQDNTLVAVIDCLIYHHYNSTDVKLLKNFLFEFNQKLCENPLEQDELDDLWVQQTAFIEVNYKDKKNLLANANLNNYKKAIQEKKVSSNNKTNQKKYSKSSKSSKNIIEYEKIKGKLLSFCGLNPPIEPIIIHLKLMYELLCKEFGFLCRQEIIDKIASDTATEIRLSKKQIQRLVLKEGFYVY
jgi:hypothetical protein